jgi:triosephosphate isomerase
MAPRRRFLMVANFKSTGTVNDVIDLARSWGATHWEHWGPEEPADETAQIVVVPSLLHIHIVREHLGPALRRIELGAQNCHPESGSDHTGETTTEMLQDSGVRWVILGHSDRRRDPLLNETNDLVARKARHVLGAGMAAVVCVGENAEERHAVKVVLSQLEAVGSQLSQWHNVAVAYEPVRGLR